ncbi:MAG TPA: bifunctional hydroxymethylpyrimidine kinase/phosphomethylpyrimidine kinase [Kiritimatiellia bacterium]|nr:bifunctional hydroxymethylpyrimidine kinase/phosphomethylpyrimidine kinase [Kiritimatiellia bacterium]
MNTSSNPRLAAVLTIAGSDSGGGAGIQADLKTFSALGVYGTSVLTCVTAQNPRSVDGVFAIPPEFVARQIQTVCEGFPITAAKTGMLYSAEIIRAVAQADVTQGIPILVVDPVMVAASGARLLQADAVEAMRTDLLPHARVITPNLHEAEILVGHPITSVNELRAAARKIGDLYDVACIAKGGALGGSEVVDVLYDEGEERVFTSPRLSTPQNHGAGCSFSAALTAGLGQGRLMADAVERARAFVASALEHAVQVGDHFPLNFEAGRHPAND